MEDQNSPKKQDYLFEHSTFVGASNAGGAIDPTLYELDSNFSILKQEIDKNSTKPNILDDIKEDQELDSSKLINLNTMVDLKLEPNFLAEQNSFTEFSPNKKMESPKNSNEDVDPNDFIIKPAQSYQVDLDFKLDETDSMDKKSPKTMESLLFGGEVPNVQCSNDDASIKDCSFEIKDNYPNFEEEKYDFVDMSASNISQASEIGSESLDLSALDRSDHFKDENERKNFEIDSFTGGGIDNKTPVKDVKDSFQSSITDGTIDIPTQRDIIDLDRTDLTFCDPSTHNSTIRSDSSFGSKGESADLAETPIQKQIFDENFDSQPVKENFSSYSNPSDYSADEAGTLFNNFNPVTVGSGLITRVESAEYVNISSDQDESSFGVEQSSIKPGLPEQTLSKSINVEESSEPVQTAPPPFSAFNPSTIMDSYQPSNNEKDEELKFSSTNLIDEHHDYQKPLSSFDSSYAAASSTIPVEEPIALVTTVTGLSQSPHQVFNNMSVSSIGTGLVDSHSSVLHSEQPPYDTIPPAAATSNLEDYFDNKTKNKEKDHAVDDNEDEEDDAFDLAQNDDDDDALHQRKLESQIISSHKQEVKVASPTSPPPPPRQIDQPPLEPASFSVSTASVHLLHTSSPEFLSAVVEEEEEQQQPSTIQHRQSFGQLDKATADQQQEVFDTPILLQQQQNTSSLVSGNNSPRDKEPKIDEQQQKKIKDKSSTQKINMGRNNRSYRDNSSDRDSISNTPDQLRESIQALLGSNAAEILYWRDPKNSGAVFGVGLIILFSLTIFSVISVVAYTFLFTLLATLSFRIYKNVMQAVNKSEDGHPFKEYLEFEIAPSQQRAHEIADQLLGHFTSIINRMRSVLLVEDYVESLKFLFLFWALTFIGSWFNGMTLVILAYMSAFSLPKVYEMHKSQIDQYLNLAISKINELTDKIPFLKKPAAVEKKDD